MNTNVNNGASFVLTVPNNPNTFNTMPMSMPTVLTNVQYGKVPVLKLPTRIFKILSIISAFGAFLLFMILFPQWIDLVQIIFNLTSLASILFSFIYLWSKKSISSVKVDIIISICISILAITFATLYAISISIFFYVPTIFKAAIALQYVHGILQFFHAANSIMKLTVIGEFA